jgi:pyruvate/2-oxoglutarate dehydrogenase complex dihydrolipoamide acyltransferase (E2) component
MPIAPNPNDRLTARWKRTLREIDNDPRDWFEAPGRAPEQVEVQLKQQPRPFAPDRAQATPPPAAPTASTAPTAAPATSGPPRLPRWRRTRPLIASMVLLAWLAVFLAVLFHKL